MSFTSTTLKFIFLVPQWYLLFFYFPMVLVLMQIRKIYWCYTRIVSSLLFGWNSFFSRLFQHFMSLTYEHEMSFICLGMIMFFSFIMICMYFKVLNTKWCSLHYVFIMWKKMIEKMYGLSPKKKRRSEYIMTFFNKLKTS